MKMIPCPTALPLHNTDIHKACIIHKKQRIFVYEVSLPFSVPDSSVFYAFKVLA